MFASDIYCGMQKKMITGTTTLAKIQDCYRNQFWCQTRVFREFKRRLFYQDLIEQLTNSRDSFKWSFYCLTNVSLVATQVLGIPIGQTEIEIPQFILKSRVFGL